MEPKDKILNLLRRQGQVSAKELVQRLGISRQAVHVHLRSLIQQGLVDKLGATRGATYCLHQSKAKGGFSLGRKFSLRKLEEDQVYAQFVRELRLGQQLSSSVERIVGYAFTEMLNNAIDHSKAQDCQIRFILEPYWAKFQIRDKGIGVFYSIASKFGLADENEAIGELVKGKTTTMAERHSGEGVFFTSKAADWLCLRSHHLSLEFDSLRDDVFVHRSHFLKGTLVTFRLRRGSRKQLASVFEKYSPQEFDRRFERTKVQVDLFVQQVVSRSQAKRLVCNLDKFREVVFDLKGVKSMGQAFADELFRVFAGRHPEIQISWVNAHPTVETMIRHVIDNQKI